MRYLQKERKKNTAKERARFKRPLRNKAAYAGAQNQRKNNNEAETNRGTHSLGGVKKIADEEEHTHVIKKLNTTMKSKKMRFRNKNTGKKKQQ